MTITDTSRVDGNNTTKRRPQNLAALPSLQIQSNETRKAGFQGKVDTSLTEWLSLPLFACFSLSEDGSSPCVKVHRSKAINLVTNQSFRVGGGRCYSVQINNI